MASSAPPVLAQVAVVAWRRRRVRARLALPLRSGFPTPFLKRFSPSAASAARRLRAALGCWRGESGEIRAEAPFCFDDAEPGLPTSLLGCPQQREAVTLPCSADRLFFGSSCRPAPSAGVRQVRTRVRRRLPKSARLSVRSSSVPSSFVSRRPRLRPSPPSPARVLQVPFKSVIVLLQESRQSSGVLSRPSRSRSSPRRVPHHCSSSSTSGPPTTPEGRKRRRSDLRKTTTSAAATFAARPPADRRGPEVAGEADLLQELRGGAPGALLKRQHRVHARREAKRQRRRRGPCALDLRRLGDLLGRRCPHDQLFAFRRAAARPLAVWPLTSPLSSLIESRAQLADLRHLLDGPPRNAALRPS